MILTKEKNMDIKFIEKKYKVTPRFKEIVTNKLAKLEKYFDDPVSVTVYASTENKSERLEVNLNAKGVLYRAEVKGNNNYENIDLTLPKLEKQIIRNKQKRVKGRRNANVDVDTFEYLEEKPDLTLKEITRVKKFELDPITTEEAKDAIERLGHTFYIFLNAETGKVNVLYKRNDGRYGLIEVEF